MRLFWWVAVAGGLGSLLRYAALSLEKGGWLPALFWYPLPAGGTTALLTVNLLGGLLTGLATNIPPRYLSANARVVIILGFCGGLTSFSAFSYETLFTLAGDPIQGLIFALGSVGLCLAAVAVGYVVAGWLF